MPITDLFFKVQVEHDADDRPERLADEIARAILRLRVYGIRSAELSNYSTHHEPEGE